MGHETEEHNHHNKCWLKTFGPVFEGKFKMEFGFGGGCGEKHREKDECDKKRPCPCKGFILNRRCWW